MLLAGLAPEYAALRNSTLIAPGGAPMQLAPGVAKALPLPAGKGLAMDLDLNFSLPANGGAVTFNTTVMAASGGASGVTLILTVPAASSDEAGSPASRTATAQLSGNVAPTNASPFAILAGETALSLRVLVDRSIVEWFIADGRSAFTARHYPARSDTGVLVTADAAATVSGVAAWDMGCGWMDTA